MTSQMSRRSSPFVTSFPDHSRTYKNVSSYSLPKISYSSRISVTDVTPPQWNSCPRDVLAFTTRNSHVATPVWIRDSASDNSGEAIDVRLVKGFESGSSTPVGSHTVTYTAVDSTGNEARPCTFTIDVRGKFYPSIKIKLPHFIT